MPIQISHLFLFLFISFSCISTTMTNLCTIEDLQKTLSPCDPRTNKRTFFYTNKDECQIANSTIQKYLDNYFFDIDCDFHCPPGHYLNYNEFNNQAICQKCPPHSFSPGKDLNIYKWNDEFLKFFEIICKTKNEKNQMVEIPCKRIVYKNSEIEFNIGEKYSSEYNILIKFEFNTINNGTMMFDYYLNKHEHLNSDVYLNLIFDDFQQKQTNQSISFQQFHSAYNKGFHVLTINFTFVNHNREHKVNEKLPSLIIKSFKALNIFDVTLNCLPCNKPQFFEGSTFCIDSPNLPLIQEFINECYEKEKNENPIINEQSVYINCLQIIESKLSEKSISNSYMSFYISFNVGNFSVTDSFFSRKQIKSNNSKWIIEDKGMYVPKFAGIQKYVFSTIINIVSHKGLFNVQFELNLMNDDEVYIKINGKKEKITKSQKYMAELYNGLNEIKIVFKRLTSVNENNPDITKDPVTITYMEIEGVENNYKLLNLKYIECPKGFVSTSLNAYICMPLTYDYFQYSNLLNINYNDIKIENKKCPLFTSRTSYDVKTSNDKIMNIRTCELQNIFEYIPEKIRYNFTDFKELLKSSLMKYEKTFFAHLDSNSYSKNEIIPLIVKNNDDNIKLFFSLFKPVLFNFTNSFSTFGHIFGVYGYNNYNKQQQYITLARKISEVKIIKSKTNNIGFMIIYDKGDVCLTDKSKNYQTAVIFKCDKRKSGFNMPHIIKTSEDKCTIITQISSKYFCKQCVSSEIVKYQKDCFSNDSLSDINNKNAFYQENEDCLIIPNSNKGENYVSINKTNDEVFFTNQNKLFKLIGYNENEFLLNDTNSRKYFSKLGDYVDNKFVNEYCGNWIKEMMQDKVVGIFVCCALYFVAICVVLALAYKYCELVNEHKIKMKENAVKNRMAIH